VTVSDTFPNGLRAKQVIGALRIQQERRIVLADQPGAGKTAQAMVALELDGLLSRRSNILILAPQTACQLTWAPEIAKRLVSQYDIVVSDLTHPGVSPNGRLKKTLPRLSARDNTVGVGLVTSQMNDLPLIVLGNYELIRWKVGEAPKMPTLFDIEWDAIIIDESHLVLPTKVDDDNELSQFWRGLKRLRTTPDPILLPMSGTPDRSLLQNRYGTWKFLWQAQFNNVWGWTRAHFVVTSQEIVTGKDPKTGQLIRRKVAEVGKLMRPEEWAAFEQAHMLRRTKKEMLEGLPDKLWAGDAGAIELPMTATQEAAYLDYCDYIEERIAQLIADGREDAAQGMKFSFYQRSRQMGAATWKVDEQDDGVHVTSHATPLTLGREGSNKLAWILDWLEARGYTEQNWNPALGKVVIVSYFVEVLKWLHAELEREGIESMVLSGETPAGDKVAIEERFQRGDLRVVLLSGFLGVSINLDAADDMIFTDFVKDADKLEQAEDRIHRASRNHQVTYWRLVSSNSADPIVLADADTRYRETRAVYEGQRGVDFARKMLGNMIHEHEGAH